MLLPIIAQGPSTPAGGTPTPVPSASPSPILDPGLASTQCVEPSAICSWVFDQTGNAVIANWVGVYFPLVMQTILILIATGFLTLVLRRLISKLVMRTMTTRVLPFDHKVITGVEDDPSAPGRIKRARTIGQILGSVAAIGTWVVAVFYIVSLYGVDIRPLLASAGIAGVAIGFGAQSLVKDYISGLFIILENQYGVGDWIKIGEAEGEVEMVSLRVTRLRDTNGTVWYIPNGTITTIANSTKHWAQALIDLPIGAAVSLEQIEALVADAGKRFSEDERFKSLLAGVPEFWGVARVDRYGPVYRVAIRTEPGHQWRVKRMFLMELKRTFDNAGVDMTISAPQPPQHLAPEQDA